MATTTHTNPAHKGANAGNSGREEATMAPKFRVTRCFTDGHLAGMEHTEVTGVEFHVGETITAGAWTGPGYVIVAVERVA